MRSLCCTLSYFLLIIREELLFLKYKITEYYIVYKRTEADEKEHSSTNQLERGIMKKNELSREEIMRFTDKSLKNILSMGFRNTDIEIGIITVEDIHM